MNRIFLYMFTHMAVLQGWVWHSARDRRTCMACIAMHGSFHTLEERLDDHVCGRCSMLPVTKSWVELGYPDIPDHRPPIEPGPEWFARQPEAVQRQMLGPAKYAAWQDGAFDLRDLVGRRRNPRWGSMRYERSLRDILGPGKAARYLDPVRRAAVEQAAATRVVNEAKRLLPPNDRHYITKVRLRSRPAERNTVVEPWVDVKSDLAGIKAGKAIRRGNTYTINNRTYGWEPTGRLYPISGDGFLQLDRGAYKALRIYNVLGNTAEAEAVLDREAISAEARARALKAWQAGKG